MFYTTDKSHARFRCFESRRKSWEKTLLFVRACVCRCVEQCPSSAERHCSRDHIRAKPWSMHRTILPSRNDDQGARRADTDVSALLQISHIAVEMSNNFIGSKIAIITKSQCRYVGTIIGKREHDLLLASTTLAVSLL